MTNPTPTIRLNREKARLGRFDFVLGLSRTLSSNQLDNLKSKFSRSGFECHLVDDLKASPQYLLFLGYNDVIGILKAANRVDIFKKCYTQTLIESKYKLRRILTEKETKHLDPQIKELEQTAKFTFARRKNFIFTPDTVKAVDQVDTKNAGQSPTRTGDLQVERTESGTLRTKLEEKDKFSEDEPFDAYIGLFTPSELCMTIASILSSIEVETAENFYEVFNVKDIGELRSVSTKLIDQLKRLEVLEFLTPLHDHNVSVGLESINNLTDYFGQNVGIYFKFMEFYTKWLIPPAVFGVIVFLLSSDKHPHFTFVLESLYCIMIMVWATLFVEFWQRRSSEICTKWHTYGDRFNAFDHRYDFKGQTRINLVTGLPQLYHPFKSKLKRYVVSISAHLPVMLFSFFLMIVFLNAKGYVLQHNSIYMPRLASLSLEGGLFDKATMWKIIPSVLQVASMVILGRVNKALSFVTTRWENHDTQTGYNNSIIAKRFLFEVLITFLHLFYIVFFRLDFDMLRSELFILFATDEIRRLAAETLVPYLKKRFLGDGIKVKTAAAEKKTDADEKEAFNKYIEEKVQEINQTEYDEFDDYLEMIVQFGYVTLFAAAFPISGVLALIFNGSEVLSDYYKLGNLYRRPMPTTVKGIGTWKDALDIMSYLCVVSNCVLMATSPAFRSMLSEDAKGASLEDVKDDMIANMHVTEHIMLIVVYLIRKVVKNEPFWVRIYMQRKAHQGN